MRIGSFFTMVKSRFDACRRRNITPERLPNRSDPHSDLVSARSRLNKGGVSVLYVRHVKYVNTY